MNKKYLEWPLENSEDPEPYSPKHVSEFFEIKFLNRISDDNFEQTSVQPIDLSIKYESTVNSNLSGVAEIVSLWDNLEPPTLHLSTGNQSTADSNSSAVKLTEEIFMLGGNVYKVEISHMPADELERTAPFTTYTYTQVTSPLILQPSSSEGNLNSRSILHEHLYLSTTTTEDENDLYKENTLPQKKKESKSLLSVDSADPNLEKKKDIVRLGANMESEEEPSIEQKKNTTKRRNTIVDSPLIDLCIRKESKSKLKKKN